MFGTLYEAIQVLQGEGYRKIINQDGSLELTVEDALLMATEEEPEKEIFFSVVGATVHVVKNGAPEPCPVATGVDKAENYMITYSAQQVDLPYVIKFCNLDEAIAYAESGAEEYSKTYQSVKWSIKLKESYVYEGGIEKIWEEVIGCDHPSYTGKIGGKKGGRAKTAKKSASSAENGKKGGRPKTNHYYVISKTKVATRLMLFTEKEMVALAQDLSFRAGTTLESVAGIKDIETPDGDFVPEREWKPGEQLEAALDVLRRDGDIWDIYPRTARGIREFRREAKKISESLYKEALSLSS